jgi:two-component system nitrate/nitrite response regulator NarL
MAKAKAGRASVLIVDDHTLFRRCLVGYLEGDPGFTIVGEAGDATSALTLARTHPPDIALVDIDLGRDNGIGLTRRLRAQCPRCAVVILTADHDEHTMRAALRAGAQGYLTKDVTPDRLVAELRRARAGEPLFSASFLLEQLRRPEAEGGGPEPTPAPNGALSEREIEVLQLLADGLTDKEVARRLHIAKDTAKNHAKRIRLKLAVANRLQATMRAIALGLVQRRS